jgi:ligand-binding sensor domain-containing protein
MRYGFLILLIIFLQARSPSIAQKNLSPQKLEFSFRTIDFTNGLLGNNVTSVAQDQRGFVWIGSLKGLQRYDGSRFVTYSNIPVAAIHSDDKNNRLWFQTPDNDVSQLNLLSNTIRKFPQDDAFGKDTKTYTDWNGNAWLVRGDYVCNPGNTGRAVTGTSLVQAPGSDDSHYASAVRDQHGKKTWINNTEHGLLLLDDDNRKVYSPEHNPIGDPLLLQLKGKKILPRSLVMDSRGNMWLFTWEWMFYRFNILTAEFKSYSTANIIAFQHKKSSQKGWVNSILEDNHGTIWLATANAGLLQYNSENDIFNYILPEQKNSSSIQFNYEIFALFQDKEENIWAATDKGISIFNPYKQYFTIFRNDEDNPRSLPKSEINALIETAKSDLFVGTWGGGITIYDNQRKFKTTIGFNNAYPKNLVWCFIQNDDGNIWAGSQYGYIHVIDPVRYSIHTFRPPELENSTIRCMTKDRQGNIWFGLHNGKVAKWDRSGNKFYSFSHTVQNDSLVTSPVTNIFIDNAGHFWVSAWKQIKQFDPGKMRFVGAYRDTNVPNLASITYYDIEELNDSTLLVGTENRGLYFFNKSSKIFSHLPINEDDDPYSAYAIKKDSTGDIWFTADYNIYKFNPKTRSFVACNPEKGMITSSFPTSDFYVSRNGQWFTWSYTEVLGFYPDSIRRRQADRIPITITGFKVFDKPVFIDSFLYSHQPVRLSHKQNFLGIEFGSLNFSGLQHTKFYYQLSGIDKDWVFAGTKLFANYTNLSPGEYSFRVKGDSADNADQITSFTIIIATPFWQTNWFKAVCLLLGIAIVYLIVRWRIKSIRHQAGLKHRIAETEMMALRAQMNPHFIFNCLNAIDNLIQTSQKGKATAYLNRFAKLIRSVLDSSKNNLVLFHKDFETLKLFLELEQFRCSDKFQFELKADPELLNSDIKVPPLIVQPFVENAIHHGLVNKEEGECKLTIDISLEKEYIKYTIIDNGIGRKQAALLKTMNKPEHVPYGIEITRKRVELHNHNGIHESILITDLEKESVPAGTKVEFWLSPQ